jgi:SpoVK/Ycf46/Vps4 family AAA+-type ATPase
MPLKPQKPRDSRFLETWSDDLIRIFWMGLGGRSEDLGRYLHRLLPKWEKENAEFCSRIQDLLKQSPAEAGQLARRVSGPQTNVFESSGTAIAAPGEDLLRMEEKVVLAIEPVWAPLIERELTSIVQERRSADKLAKAGLRPTHTVIFTGLPGVGKTLAARWLARELGLPLAILNLGSVMSSFLGRTGANLRQVLSFASSQPCVLLLDELDAIAKRRDDSSDIGELKRLVTVLLQELDAWPSNSLLVAATNHEQLIDPAVWRRFERRVAFPLPGAEQQALLLGKLLGSDWEGLDATTQLAVSTAATKLSPSDLTQLAHRTKREVIVSQDSFEPRLLENFSALVSTLPLVERRKIGLELKRKKLGQREINRVTGLARETIRELPVN